jgi:Crp-like helix-turn-helix domain
VIHRVTPPGHLSVNAPAVGSALEAVNAWVQGLSIGECITIRQRDLAARLGMSQPHVSRCLNALKLAGHINLLSAKTGTLISRRAGQEATTQHVLGQRSSRCLSVCASKPALSMRERLSTRNAVTPQRMSIRRVYAGSLLEKPNGH